MYTVSLTNPKKWQTLRYKNAFFVKNRKFAKKIISTELFGAIYG